MSELVYRTTNFENAIFLDLSPTIGLTVEPDLLENIKAIRSSFWNILTTPIGTRYRLEAFGSVLMWILNDPGDATTALQIRAATIQALSRWETRVNISDLNITVTPSGVDTYILSVPYYMPQFSQSDTFVMDLRRQS